MVWFLLGVFTSLSFAGPKILFSVPQPSAQVVLACNQLPTAMDESALEKEIPNLRVIFFESGFHRGWLAKNGMRDAKELDEFEIVSFRSEDIPDFWHAFVRYTLPNKEEGLYEFVSSVKDIEKNGNKIQMLEVYVHDGNGDSVRVMRMGCKSFQTWI